VVLRPEKPAPALEAIEEAAEVKAAFAGTVNQN